jgi:hypothetical protein
MMCEVPSNAILADQFLEYFDGFSIGSNDLTQLTLGLDRDSGLELLARDFDERDPAVKALISRAIAPAGPGQVRRHLRPRPQRPPRLCDWLAQRRHRVDLAEPGHRRRDLGDGHGGRLDERSLVHQSGGGAVPARLFRQRQPARWPGLRDRLDRRFLSGGLC